jgi:hypothetical protein
MKEILILALAFVQLWAAPDPVTYPKKNVPYNF